jgi:hypothetical protein
MHCNTVIWYEYPLRHCFCRVVRDSIKGDRPTGESLPCDAPQALRRQDGAACRRGWQSALPRRERAPPPVATTSLFLSWAFLPQGSAALFSKTAVLPLPFKTRTVTKQLCATCCRPAAVRSSFRAKGGTCFSGGTEAGRAASGGRCRWSKNLGDFRRSSAAVLAPRHSTPSQLR